MNYYYYCIITDSNTNTITSQVATINVISDPVSTITAINATYSLNASNVIPLTVSVTGGMGTTIYQWYSNIINSNVGGVVITGATLNSYTPLVNTVGTSYYYCVISQSVSGCNFTSPVNQITVYPVVNPSSNGTAIISSFNSCATASAGTLTAGVGVSGVTQTINVTVGTIGTYSISATSNGVTFAATGTFTTTGAQDLVLTASGTPTAPGSTTFNLNTTPSCSFTLISSPPFIVNAGVDQCGINGVFGGVSACGTSGSRPFLKVNLTGSTIPSGGTASWDVVSSNSSYSPSYCMYNSITGAWNSSVINNNLVQFAGKPGSTYTLRYSVTLNGFTSYDDVTICFNSCKNYRITRNGGTNQYSFWYAVCGSDLSSDPQFINDGVSVTVCAFPGSVQSNNSSIFTITTLGNCN